jgi:TPR repeat protein
MRLFLGIVLAALPVLSAAQIAPDGFCENLATFEDLTPANYASLQQWSEDYIDTLFASRSRGVQFSDVMPEDWLRNQVAKSIADCYLRGRRTEQNTNKAMAVLEGPASSGDSGAAHMLASIQVFRSDDPELQREGFLTLKQEADDGSAYSAGKLGWAYALGRGTEKSEKRALEQYFIAAKAGMTYWQFLLAHVYEQGYYGQPVDPERADYWRTYKPKIHIAKYECVIAQDYERGIFPANEQLQKQYMDACVNQE